MKLKLKIFSTLLFLNAFTYCVQAQNVCNSSGNLIIYTNYDGGTLNISVDQNIPNLVIGVVGYEATSVNLSGTYLSNVVAVRYAGYNGTNNPCGGVLSTTINGAPSGASTSTVFAPAATISNSNGYGMIICGYSCSNNTNQGGCNTVDQIEAYFLNYFPGTSLFAHMVQYGCWSGTYSVSAGGSCCPLSPFLQGSVAGDQSVCSGNTVTPFTSVTAASGGTGTISYQWESSTTSPGSGFSIISGANAATYSSPPLSGPPALYYFRRGVGTALNPTAYSNVITVTVDPTPVIQAIYPLSVCEGDPVNMTAAGAGITSYNWSGPGGFSAATQAVFIPALNAMSSGVYTVTGVTSGSCVSSSTLGLVPTPLPAIIASGATVCIGQTATLSANGATTYSWSGPQNYAAYTASITIPSTMSIPQTYTVVGALNNCTNIATALIQTLPLPVISLVATPTVVCKGQSVALKASGAQTYSWVSVSTSTSSSIAATPTANTTYTVIGTAGNSCKNFTTIAVSIFTCTGIEELPLQTNDVLIYPNPNSGSFTMRSIQAIDLELLDNLGRLVKTVQLNETNDYNAIISNLANGLYYIISKDKGQTIRRKVMVGNN